MDTDRDFEEDEEETIGHKLALAAGDPNPVTKLKLLNWVIDEIAKDDSAVWDNYQVHKFLYRIFRNYNADKT